MLIKSASRDSGNETIRDGEVDDLSTSISKRFRHCCKSQTQDSRDSDRLHFCYTRNRAHSGRK